MSRCFLAISLASERPVCFVRCTAVVAADFFEVFLAVLEVFLGVFLGRVGACLEDLAGLDREWLPRFAPDWVANANRSC
ncbi:MAG: hypothetical protein IH884_13965 [Myxococcales bacterium]|nr:hypothetical protein [Myxococcales bacterium]